MADLPRTAPAFAEDTGLLGTFAATLGVLILGLAGAVWATDGGRSFTTEALRRSQVERTPQALPDFAVVDGSGQSRSLQGLWAAGGKVWIVDFVYTRCVTLCLSAGSSMQQLQAQIVAQGLASRVGLMTISFDPENDGPAALAAYVRRVRADPAVWQVLSLARPADRRRLLDSFGIMVVPAPGGEFEHNAALHLVSPPGLLLRILGLDQGAQALALAAP